MDSGADVIVSPPLPSVHGAEHWQRGSPATRARYSAAADGAIFLARSDVLLALDITLSILGLALAYIARYVLRIGGLHQTIVPIPVMTASLLGIGAVVLTVLELARAGAYRRSLSMSAFDGYVAVLRAVTIAMAAVIVTSAALQEQTISRLTYPYAWLLIVGLLFAGRGLRTLLLARIYRTGRGARRVVVVGATSVGKMVMQNMAARVDAGYRVVGFVGEHAGTPHRFGRFQRLGTLSDLDVVLSKYDVDEVIVALPSAAHGRIAEIFAHCKQASIPTKFVPDLFDLRLSRVRLDAVAGIPLIDVRNDRLHGLRPALKRLLDITVAAAALLAASPILVITALAIKLESPGPLLFRQERLGKDHKPFTIYKFRSMRTDAERQLALLLEHNEASGPIFKMRNDPRVTRVGRIIRTLSVDELPQLWNVVRGDMSLVGPRPPLEREVEKYEDWHRRRLEVTPGITCLWGVSGRSKLDFDEMVMLDLYYIDNWSLGLDLRILVRTALTLLRPSGAY